MCGVKVVEPEEGLVHSSVLFFALTSCVVRGHQLSCKPDLVPCGGQSLFIPAGGRWSRNNWLIYWSCFGFAPYCLTDKNVTRKVILLKTVIQLYLQMPTFLYPYDLAWHPWRWYIPLPGTSGSGCLRWQSTHWVLFYLFHNINLETTGREVFT